MIKEDKIITIYTETEIDGAHQLVGYNGKCSRMHGHTWLLRLWVRGQYNQRNKDGILFDFTNIKKIAEEFDHNIINDVMSKHKLEIQDRKHSNPTAENLSYYIYENLKKENPSLEFVVRLYETAVLKKTYCEVGDFDV